MVTERLMVDATAFDAVAARYDAAFTETLLARLLRARVWALLEDHFRAGQRLLELACGTGEDALWLAQRGCRVVAVDGSAEMLAVARRKLDAHALGACVQFNHLSLQAIIQDQMKITQPLDGLFSNFGGLNTIGAWRPLARALAPLIRPGGRAVLVVMGPVCPWEIGWHLLHRQVRQARRRLRGVATARVGDQAIPVWYPSARRLASAFSPWFHPLQTHSLGLWLPPSYLAHLVPRMARLFFALSRFEQATGRWTGGWGDHYILVLERGR